MAEKAIGPELLKAAGDAFDHQENVLNQKARTLSQKKTHMEIGARVIHELEIALRSGKPCDLNQDENIKKLVLCIHRHHPHIFDHLVEKFPEGVLTQSLSAETLEELVEESLKDVHLNEVHIKPLIKEDIDVLIHSLEKQINMHGQDVNQETFEINRIFGDREQLVRIMHEILRQMNELLKSINRHTGG